MNPKDTRMKCNVCSKLPIKLPERCHYPSAAFVVNFKQILHINIKHVFRFLNHRARRKKIKCILFYRTNKQ